MRNRLILSLFIILTSLKTYSQNSTGIVLPILDLNSNARLGGIADLGVVSSIFYKDAGLFQSPSLISNNSKYTGSNLFFRNTKDETNENANIYGWSGYFATNLSNAFGFNFSYLNYENILITNESNEFASEFEPYEMFFQLTYAHKFNNSLSAGLGIKYIRSNYAFLIIENVTNSFALDLGFSYHKSYTLLNNSNLNTSAGIAITNFGPRIKNDENQKAFIPTKLLFGLFINPDIHINRILQLNIELGYQAEKYLVPSEPIYNTEGDIIEGKNPDINIFNALYQSFCDSPDGFSGEIDEIRNKFGSEFRLSYSNTSYLAFRHGRIFELESLGGENYQTFGCGIGLWGFMIDYCYTQSDNITQHKNWYLTLGVRHNLEGDFFRF